MPAARLPLLVEAMSCNARKCRKTPSLAAVLSAPAMRPSEAATSSTAAMLQLTVLDNNMDASD